MKKLYTELQQLIIKEIIATRKDIKYAKNILNNPTLTDYHIKANELIINSEDRIIKLKEEYSQEQLKTLNNEKNKP